MSGYQVPSAPATHEIIIKNSRFIASLWPVTSAAEHQHHLRYCQQQWPGATHYCTAAIWGAPHDSQTYAMSDDGEPSGTAGRPMFHVLQASGLGEVSVIVVRYFGGIKLGTGGLQRAYSQAVSEVLKGVTATAKILRKTAYINYDYADQSVVTHTLQKYDAIIEKQDFTAAIEAQLRVVAATAAQLQTDIKNITQGRVSMTIASEAD